jgi:hypothetical protein
MSVATIDYSIEETAAQSHDSDVVDLTDWLTRTASLSRPFTRVYVPRHRADGPAV